MTGWYSGGGTGTTTFYGTTSTSGSSIYWGGNLTYWPEHFQWAPQNSLTNGWPIDPSNEKALQLLLETLDEGQKAMLTKEGKFVVFGSRGNGYQVRKDQTVLLLAKDGREVESWCFGPEGSVPVYDKMLAQKLLLEADEELAYRVANRIGV